MANQLQDLSEVARRIIAGELDVELEHIQQAIAYRRKAMFRKGAKIRLHDTRDPELDGREGVILKVNPKRITVGLGEKRGERPYEYYEQEYNVPPSMLELL